VPREERHLTVIGEGRDRARLEALAGPQVTFRGRLPFDEVKSALQRCRALLLPGAEDFGMTAVEAQAAGRPVIAYGQGGALESVVDGETGVLFSEPTVGSMVSAMRRLDALAFDPEGAIWNAWRFDTGEFEAAIRQAVAEARSMGSKRGTLSGARRTLRPVWSAAERAEPKA
jgi:glycosyltransferase involved in cell wall biosynthesis